MGVDEKVIKRVLFRFSTMIFVVFFILKIDGLDTAIYIIGSLDKTNIISFVACIVRRLLICKMI